MIQTYEYLGKGYDPFLIEDTWQIAQLNYIEEQDFLGLKK